MPDLNQGDRLATIRGSVPSNLNNIVGDAFAVRNDYALGIDFVEEPKFYWVSPTHRVKSALLDERTENTPHQNTFKNCEIHLKLANYEYS